MTSRKKKPDDEQPPEQQPDANDEAEPWVPPHLFTPRRQALLLDALRNGQTIKAACARAGIHHTTYYKWLNDKSVDFGHKVDLAKAEAEARLVDAITQSAHTGETVVTPGGKTVIRPGDWRAAAWLLEHHPHTREAYAGILKQKLTVAPGLPEGISEGTEDPDAAMGTLERMAAVVAVLQRAGVMPQLLSSSTVDVTPEEAPDAAKP